MRFHEIIVEGAAHLFERGESLVMYHGTTLANVPGILKYGLRPSERGEAGEDRWATLGGVYLTSSFAYALKAARNTYPDQPHAVVVVRAAMDKAKPDEDVVEQALTKAFTSALDQWGIDDHYDTDLNAYAEAEEERPIDSGEKPFDREEFFRDFWNSVFRNMSSIAGTPRKRDPQTVYAGVKMAIELVDDDLRAYVDLRQWQEVKERLVALYPRLRSAKQHASAGLTIAHNIRLTKPIRRNQIIAVLARKNGTWAPIYGEYTVTEPPLSEAVDRIAVHGFGREVTVWSDIAKDALVQLAMKHALRCIATKHHFWVWNALFATHRPMAKALGVADGVYVYIASQAEAAYTEWQTSPRYAITPPVYCYYGMTGDPLLTRLGDYLSEDDEEEVGAALSEVTTGARRGQMIFVKQAVKSPNGTIWAPGKADVSQEGYFDRADYQIWRLCLNYDGKVRGGMRKTWRLSKDNLSLEQAKSLLAKKVQKPRGVEEAVDTGAARLPPWWQRGQVLSLDDLDHLDASEFIEGDEFGYEWRLCRVPVRLLPTLTDDEIADMDRQEPGRMDSVRNWLREHGGEALRDRPLVALLTMKGISLLDGWHRATAATELGWREMYAAVGLGENTED